ncbi:MAG: NAD(P)-binding domain-containing protein [Pirellulaceae bacterium]
MAIDTPATIAILGAGPMGIETGLYARYLGYDVMILETREVAAHVLAWGHLQLFSPFRQLRSSLGLAALRAQDPAYRPPASDAQLTGKQWVDRYVRPLSQTDLLADHLRCGTRVVTVGRQPLQEHEPADDEPPDDNGFCVRVQQADGQHANELADIVIDCTGVYANPEWCGAGGNPARGELQLRDRIEYGVPDILGAARSTYQGRRTLVVGDGLAAAAAIVALVDLTQLAAETHVTWLTHRPLDSADDSPISTARYGQLPERQRLAHAANQHAQIGSLGLDFRPGTCLASIEYDDLHDKYVVQFDNRETPERFDRVIANVGYRPDHSLYEQLRVIESPATENPLATRGRRESQAPASAAETAVSRGDRLLTTEPNFYILGAKSYGRDASFLMADGLQQIRDLFGVIGGRPELDLYATAARLAP